MSNIPGRSIKQESWRQSAALGIMVVCVRGLPKARLEKRVVAERASVICLCSFSIGARGRKVSAEGQTFHSIRLVFKC